MLPYAAFHLGIHCLQSTPLPVLRMKRVENVLYNTVYAFSLKGFTYDKILKKKVWKRQHSHILPQKRHIAHIQIHEQYSVQ